MSCCLENVPSLFLSFFLSHSFDLFFSQSFSLSSILSNILSPSLSIFLSPALSHFLSLLHTGDEKGCCFYFLLLLLLSLLLKLSLEVVSSFASTLPSYCFEQFPCKKHEVFDGDLVKTIVLKCFFFFILITIESKRRLH